MNTFPTLRLGLLQNLLDLKRQFSADSGIFEQDSCPYDRETVAVLTSLMETTVVEVEKVVEKVVEVTRDARGVNDEDMGVVEDELRICLTELRNINKEREGVAKVDDETLLKVLKAKSTLIEQIVKLREKVMTLRRASEFEVTIMGVLEDLIDEDGRAEFLRRLLPYRDAGR